MSTHSNQDTHQEKGQSQERQSNELPQSSLGKIRDTPYTYTPSLLESIPFAIASQFDGLQNWVSLRCLRFSSLCPVTGQPDWAELDIHYIPEAHILESKALKEYLNSFRMHGDFHEDVCRIIVRDLVKSCNPQYLEIHGRFDSRGSIAIWPFVQWAQVDNEKMQSLLQQRMINYDPAVATVR